MVQRCPLAVEELAELWVGGDVVAYGERGQTRGVVGAGGEPAVFRRVDGGERTVQVRSDLIVVAAHREHGGRGQVGRRGHRLQRVRGGRVTGLAGGGERLIPAPAVDAGPLQGGQRGPRCVRPRLRRAAGRALPVAA